MAKSNKLPDLPIPVIEEALSNIPADLPRDQWVQVAMGLHSELGDAGFDLFDRWSSTVTGYNAKACRHVWDSIDPGALSIGTVIHWAKHYSGWSVDPSRVTPMTDDEREQRQATRKAILEEAARVRRERQREAAIRSQNMWNDAGQVAEHPYLQKKQISAHGLKIGPFSMEKSKKPGEFYNLSRCLLIPMRDMANEIHGLQAIPWKREPWMTTSNKFFTKHCDPIGKFHMIGEMGETVAFCEGYATGATIHELTGWCVIVCFTCGNLQPVVESFAKEFTGIRMVVVGDNDQWTKDNPGATTARAVANLVHARSVVPQFRPETIQANTVTEDGKTRGPTDINDLYLLEGAGPALMQLSEKVIDMATFNRKTDNDEPELNAFATECYAVLGYNDGVYYYLSRASGQITPLKPSAHTQLNLMQLAPLDWWAHEFPLPGGKIDWAKAASDLTELCHQRGIFSPELIRGRGAWWDDKRAIFHFGPHLEVDGKQMDLVDLRSDYTYQKQLSLGVPDAAALSTEEGLEILKVANAFRWRVPASAPLVAGWIALATVCGALNWRPHVWITGGAGCGKSTVLNNFCGSLLGNVKLAAQGNSTEAGIRQKLRNDALPVLFDETESNNDREALRVQNILSMVRQASSESGAQTFKGSGTGEAMAYTIRSMFCFASIQVALKQQADLERLTVCHLRAKEEQSEHDLPWRELEAMIDKLRMDKKLPAKLFRRSLNLLPVTLKNIRTFVNAAAEHFGTVREGDQYGTLLAGAWSLISDEEITHEQALNEIRSYAWDEITEYARHDESQEVLQRILLLTERSADGVTCTLQDIAMQAAGMPSGAGISETEARRMLKTMSMRIADGGLVIPNGCPWIERRLKDSKFAADWRGQLVRVDGVQRPKKAYKFGGVPVKCVLIPASMITDEPSQEALL